MKTEIQFLPGDVLSYVPETSHCREGTAFVTDPDRAVDTYWQPRGDGESHVLTEQELATARVRFNVYDFDALDRYSPSSRETWEKYHPDDRGRISSQHGLQEALFIRRGAKPDLATQIESARAAVESAERELSAAKRNLHRRQEKLAGLMAVANVRPFKGTGA